MALTADQLQAIDRHLRKDNWLLNEALITELTDHYMAGIDEQMIAGVSFEKALTEVHAGFGGRKGLLKMEEDYQIQNARRIGIQEWRTVRSFVEGPRWYITLIIFGLLYALNANSDESEMVSSALFVGQFFVAGTVLASLFMSLWMFYASRREVNTALANQPTSVVYVMLYCLSLALVLLNKYGLSRYGLSLTSTMLTGLNTLLETLCIVYYIAIGLTLKNTLTRTNSLKKA